MRLKVLLAAGLLFTFGAATAQAGDVQLTSLTVKAGVSGNGGKLLTNFTRRTGDFDTLQVTLDWEGYCTKTAAEVDPALNAFTVYIGNQGYEVPDACTPYPEHASLLDSPYARPGETEYVTFFESRFYSVPERRRPSTRRFPIDVTWAGGALPRHIVTIKGSRYQPYRSATIWDYQTDPFYNVCIKQARETYSRGGNLYCEIERQASILVSVRTRSVE